MATCCLRKHCGLRPRPSSAVLRLRLTLCARAGRFLVSAAAADVSGRRFIAGQWPADASVEEGRAASEAPIAWPELADSKFFVGEAVAAAANL